MHYSLWVLTAAWVAGGPLAALPAQQAGSRLDAGNGSMSQPTIIYQGVSSAPGQPTMIKGDPNQPVVIYQNDAPPPENKGLIPRFFDRVFHRNRPPTMVQPTSYYQTSEPALINSAEPKVMPVPAGSMPAAMPGHSAAPTQVIQTSAAMPATQASPAQGQAGMPATMTTDFPLKREYWAKTKHETGYSWMTGELFYLHADGGIWVIRYAPAELHDMFGGKLVLSTNVDMKNFREGDLVTVHGAVLKEKHASSMIGGPLYRADSIDLVEHGAK